MKQITFEVKLSFKKELTDVEIAIVQQNIMSALVYMEDTQGLTPFDCDDENQTTNVQIFEPLTQSMIAKEFN